MRTAETEKKRREQFNRTGSGHWSESVVYEDTMTQSEAMRARGYHQLADGTWVP